MKPKPGLQLQILFLIVTFFLTISATDLNSRKHLKIGSKRFTESYIIGEMLKQVAEHEGEAEIKYESGLGNTGIVFAAIQNGLIDIYPEYTGTIVFEILQKPELSHASIEELNRHLKPLHLAISDSLGFHNNYALAMRNDRAEELGIQTISDLALHPELKMGFSHEFLGRSDGWSGLKSSQYHLPHTHIIALDHSLAYEAIARDKIDVLDIYSTDPKINKYDLKILKDDQHFFPEYAAVLLYRDQAPQTFPKTWKAFQDKLIHRITPQAMIFLNAQAELDGKKFSEIASQFLSPSKEKNHRSQSFWQLLFGPDLWPLTKQHLFLVFGALLPAIFVGLFLGIIATYWTMASHVILNIIGIIQTIPSIALLAFFISIFKEIGNLPALVALFLYSLLPIVRNTFAGLTNIPIELRDSALALGLPFFHRLILIELPLASRTILAGIKTAAVLNVGTATIAAFIGAGGYGDRIVTGLALNNDAILLSGAIPACILAICVQLGFDLLDYCLIPNSPYAHDDG